MVPETKTFSGWKSLWTILRSWGALRPFVDCIDMSNLSKKLYFSSSFHISRTWLTVWTNSPSIFNSQYSNTKIDGQKLYPTSWTTFSWAICNNSLAIIWILSDRVVEAFNYKKLSISFIFIHSSSYTFSNLVAKINWKSTFSYCSNLYVNFHTKRRIKPEKW